MEVMSGFGGKPVQIKNLPNPAYQDYTQYKSVAHTHASDKAKWSHSGTNGFTSTMEAEKSELRIKNARREFLIPNSEFLIQYPAAFPAAERPSDPPCSQPPSLTIAATCASTTPGA